MPTSLTAAGRLSGISLEDLALIRRALTARFATGVRYSADELQALLDDVRALSASAPGAQYVADDDAQCLDSDIEEPDLTHAEPVDVARMSKLARYLRAERGRTGRIARVIGVSYVTLWQIAYGVRPCPAERAPAIERACENQVRRWDLLPRTWHSIWPELIDTDGAPSILPVDPTDPEPQE